MKWFSVNNTNTSNFPEWARSFGIDKDNVVFIPAEISDVSEKEIALMINYDETRSVTYKNHLYVPSKWLAKNFPAAKDLCMLIESEANKLT